MNVNLEKLFEQIIRGNRIYYHGSPAKFNTPKSTSNIRGAFEPTFFLTSVQQFALFYTKNSSLGDEAEDFFDEDDDDYSKNGYLYYFKLKKPANIFNAASEKDYNLMKKIIQVKGDCLTIKQTGKQPTEETLSPHDKKILKIQLELAEAFNKDSKEMKDKFLQDLQEEQTKRGGIDLKMNQKIDWEDAAQTLEKMRAQFNEGKQEQVVNSYKQEIRDWGDIESTISPIQYNFGWDGCSIVEAGIENLLIYEPDTFLNMMKRIEVTDDMLKSKWLSKQM